MGNCCKRITTIELPLSIESDSTMEENSMSARTRVFLHDLRTPHTIKDDTRLDVEYLKNRNKNSPYLFHDIVDIKHEKYMEKYVLSLKCDYSLFWGMGIENESYLMLNKKRTYNTFSKLKRVRERYSVDYYKNFKSLILQSVFDELKTIETLTYPIYVNAHSFKNMDIHGQHRTIYNIHNTCNPYFTESVHDLLMRENEYYRDHYDKSFVFDGDSIEFITQNFYNTTVSQCVQELIEMKQRFLYEITPFFSKLDTLLYPDHNYGLVSFHTTGYSNLGICNNGTYHLNLTLPTILYKGSIANKSTFAHKHLNLICVIQILEPLFVACYGTPDVFSVLPNTLRQYSVGSLRVSLSRYISLQTYQTATPVNGKLLLFSRPLEDNFWYNQLHSNSPYQMNDKIGYDINFNKFKNHGIEIRFLDWFPPQYLSDVMNFFVLCAQHSLYYTMITFIKGDYQDIILKCVRDGFRAILTAEECNTILRDLNLIKFSVSSEKSPFELLCYLSTILYEMYWNSDLIKLMSPNMMKPVMANYNRIAFEQLYYDLYQVPYS